MSVAHITRDSDGTPFLQSCGHQGGGSDEDHPDRGTAPVERLNRPCRNVSMLMAEHLEDAGSNDPTQRVETRLNDPRKIVDNAQDQFSDLGDKKAVSQQSVATAGEVDLF
ncbi:MAG TPA: hypothetical protein EYN73_03560 [Chromatiaceae bacterium]|nr:hypothetical protein [Chromatiaceae bacterium]HIB83154.1 hypothetical protein [Chromatiaceae bacterium]HIN82256.1 hypothetical protein [Chromatiales bacterium]HIO54043.1 hypothetical protein [Chromatiales bacterium]